MKTILLPSALLCVCAVAAAASPDFDPKIPDKFDVSLEPALFLGLDRVPAEFNYLLREDGLVIEMQELAQTEDALLIQKGPAPEPPASILVVAGLGCLGAGVLLRTLPGVLRSTGREQHRKGRRRVKVELRMMA